jgi:hypothetical protein
MPSPTLAQPIECHQQFIEILVLAQIEGMHFQPHSKEGLSVNLPGEGDRRFTLRPSEPEKDACGNLLGLEGLVTAQYEVTEGIFEFVGTLIADQTLTRTHSDMTLPFEEEGTTKINEDGSLVKGFGLYTKHCPEDVVELLQSAKSELSGALDRALGILRWRQGVDAPSILAPDKSLFWRVGPGVYSLAPLESLGPYTISGQAMFGVHCQPEDGNDIAELFGQDQVNEPLGHALLREACTLATESPRSAILILAAALETGVKTHVSNVAPETAWLMENIPSPPIFKILRDYIPILHRKGGGDLAFWEELKPTIKQAQDLFATRNKVAHTGTVPSDAKPIHEVINTVSDLLYVLDFLEGHEWARGRLGWKLRQKLKWPAPRHSPSQITITMGS